MGLKSTQEVNNAAKWKTWLSYSCLLAVERHPRPVGEELTLRDIQTAIDGKYEGNRKQQCSLTFSALSKMVR